MCFEGGHCHSECIENGVSIVYNLVISQIGATGGMVGYADREKPGTEEHPFCGKELDEIVEKYLT